MPKIRCLGFGLSHLRLKMGQLKPTSIASKQSLKVISYRLFSLNDQIFSVAKTKPFRIGYKLSDFSAAYQLDARVGKTYGIAF